MSIPARSASSRASNCPNRPRRAVAPPGRCRRPSSAAAAARAAARCWRADRETVQGEQPRVAVGPDLLQEDRRLGQTDLGDLRRLALARAVPATATSPSARATSRRASRSASASCASPRLAAISMSTLVWVSSVCLAAGRLRLVQLLQLHRGFLLLAVGRLLLLGQPPLPELVEEPLDRVCALPGATLRLRPADQHRDAVDVVLLEAPAELLGRARAGSPRAWSAGPACASSAPRRGSTPTGSGRASG